MNTAADDYPGSALRITAAEWALVIRERAGMVVVADGTSEAALRLERVLTTDPGMGVLRHADAGYPEDAKLRPSPPVSGYPWKRSKGERV